MNMYVSNLGFHTSDEDLKQLFESFGLVTSAKVITHRDTGRSRGFGFVEMQSSADANQAMDKLNRREHIEYRPSKPQEQPARIGHHHAAHPDQGKACHGRRHDESRTCYEGQNARSLRCFSREDRADQCRDRADTDNGSRARSLKARSAQGVGQQEARPIGDGQCNSGQKVGRKHARRQSVAKQLGRVRRDGMTASGRRRRGGKCFRIFVSSVIYICHENR